jgi:hypothetical protein
MKRFDARLRENSISNPYSAKHFQKIVGKVARDIVDFISCSEHAEVLEKIHIKLKKDPLARYMSKENEAREYVARVLEKKLPNNCTPVDLFLEKKMGAFSDEEFAAALCLLQMFVSHFEVLSASKHHYVFRDLRTERKYQIYVGDMPQIGKGEYVFTRLIPFLDGQHGVYGLVITLGPEQRGYVQKVIQMNKEMRQRLYELFLKRFGTFYKEFPSIKSALAAQVDFLNFYNQERSKELNELVPIPELKTNFKGLHEVSGPKNKRHAFVCDPDFGMGVIHYFGYIVDIFKGKAQNVPHWEELLEQALEEPKHVPGTILRRLLEEHRTTVFPVLQKYYAEFEFKDFDDVFRFIQTTRGDLFDQDNFCFIAAKPSEVQRLLR